MTLLAEMLTDIPRVVGFCINSTMAIIQGEVEKTLFINLAKQVCNGHHVHK